MTAQLAPRAAVRAMKEYHPPLAGRTGLRLDFNENTFACSPAVAEVLRKISSEELTKYPEREPIERIAAEHLGFAPEQLLLANGVDEAIHLLCEAFLEPGDEVLIPVPTFSMYEIYALQTGATVRTVQASADDGFHFPTEQLLAAITPQTKLIAIASPNNPTGQVASRADLLRIVAAAPQAAVLIDEAYFDFFGETLITDVAAHENLFIARTFSKAYGMAGLRVGILCGPATQMRFVRKVSSPYNVNGIALACLPAAMRDRDFIATYVAQVKEGRARLEQALAAHGIRYWPSQANFVLGYYGDFRQPFAQAMRERGILVRDRNSDPGCAGCVRITVGTREQTDRLLATLDEVLAQIGWPEHQRPGAPR